jgi:hypothetical protein
MLSIDTSSNIMPTVALVENLDEIESAGTDNTSLL